MSKRLVCSALNTISWEEYELPKQLEPGQLSVRNTHGAEKHGTKVAYIHGHGNKRGRWDAEKKIYFPNGIDWNYPFALGNIQVGIVEEIGKAVKGYELGDRILYFGGFAPTAVIGTSEIWKLHRDTNWKTATCLDPATYALCALRDGNTRVGDAVAIFSLGAIGLMAVQLAKLAGCYPIIAIDPLANRREVALKTGADIALNPIGLDVGYALKEATGWRGVDVVIEYSGSMEAMQASLRGVAFGGNIVAGGFPGPMKAGLDLGAEAHMNRPNILFTRTESDPSRDHPSWNNVRIRSTIHRMILEGLISGEHIVTPILKFHEKLNETYDQIAEKPEQNIKLGVEY